MRADVVILTLASLCSLLVYSEACSCQRSHPQQHYCKSDFVILARVRRERIFNDTKIFKVRVRKPYKFNEKTEVALKSGRILTSAYENLCGGFDLQPGKLYVLSGRIISLQARMTMCDMIMEWNKLSRRQRKGLKRLYKHGCTCDIRKCYKKCTRQRDWCNWSSDCETVEGICMRQANGSCMWTRNKALNMCKAGVKGDRYYYTNTNSSSTTPQNTALLYHLP